MILYKLKDSKHTIGGGMNGRASNSAEIQKLKAF
jgi:hypothetical protein